MNYVTELLEEQKELLTEEMRFAEGEELEQTKQRMTDVVDALNKLSIHDVVVSDADIYLASADEEVDLLDARGFRQGAKWCRRQY